MVGVELDSQAKNPLGFTVHTSAGEKLQIVAKNGVQKQVRLSRMFPWSFLARSRGVFPRVFRSILLIFGSAYCRGTQTLD